MARDPGLEEVVRERLAGEPGLAEQPMFGGLAWLLNGNLLCAARHDGLLARLGKGKDGWALAHPGVTTLMAGSRPMAGWVRAEPEAAADDDLRERLISQALDLVRPMPPKGG